MELSYHSENDTAWIELRDGPVLIYAGIATLEKSEDTRDVLVRLSGYQYSFDCRPEHERDAAPLTSCAVSLR